MSATKSPTVLLIDNDEDLLTAMRMRLELMGYICRTAATGAQGLSEFAAGGVDLIVTDLNMPVLDGIGFVEKVRKTSDVPVIVISGFRHEYKRHLRRLRNVLVQPKPFSAMSLVDLIETELTLNHVALPQEQQVA